MRLFTLEGKEVNIQSPGVALVGIGGGRLNLGWRLENWGGEGD